MVFELPSTLIPKVLPAPPTAFIVEFTLFASPVMEILLVELDCVMFVVTWFDDPVIARVELIF
jgi:hypothetical protein